MVLFYQNEEQGQFLPTEIKFITWSGLRPRFLFAGHPFLGDRWCCGGGLWWCRWWRAGRFQGPGLLFTILPVKFLFCSEVAHLSGGGWSSLLLRFRRASPCYQNTNKQKQNKPLIHMYKVIYSRQFSPNCCWHCSASLRNAGQVWLGNRWHLLGCWMSV